MKDRGSKVSKFTELQFHEIYLSDRLPRPISSVFFITRTYLTLCQEFGDEKTKRWERLSWVQKPYCYIVTPSLASENVVHHILPLGSRMKVDDEYTVTYVRNVEDSKSNWILCTLSYNSSYKKTIETQRLRVLTIIFMITRWNFFLMIMRWSITLVFGRVSRKFQSALLSGLMMLMIRLKGLSFNTLDGLYQTEAPGWVKSAA